MKRRNRSGKDGNLSVTLGGDGCHRFTAGVGTCITLGVACLGAPSSKFAERWNCLSLCFRGHGPLNPRDRALTTDHWVDCPRLFHAGVVCVAPKWVSTAMMHYKRQQKLIKTPDSFPTKKIRRPIIAVCMSCFV